MLTPSPRPHTPLSPYLLIPLAAALLAGLLYFANTALESKDAGWYQLYFTNPVYPDDKKSQTANSLDNRVAAAVTVASRSVDIATRDFDLANVADAMIAAHRRGVAVRMVIDNESANGEQVQRLLAAGIPVVDDGRDADMHDKFMIVDGQTVWVGSWNFTENSTFRNNNVLMAITAPSIVANYQTEFDEMFVQRKFGPDSPADTPNPQAAVNDVLIENYFAPEDGVAQHIVETINSAAQSVRFAAYNFTLDEIAQAITARANAGVSVQGVYEAERAGVGSNSTYGALKADNLPVLLDGNPYTMHHKFFVIDNQIVIFGSYNFTNSSERQNDENVLIIHDAAIAQAFLAEFERIWEQAGAR